MIHLIIVIVLTLITVYAGAVPLASGVFRAGFGNVLNIDCVGDEIQLSECTVSLHANYDHTDDAGVACERCVDRCDLGSTREVCMTTSPPDQTTETQGTVPRTNNLGMTGAAVTCFNDNIILGAFVGVLLVVLIAVIIGWVATCILMRAKIKSGEYIMNDQ